MMTTRFAVVDDGGYVVRVGLPIDQAATLATRVGGTVTKMHLPSPTDRLHAALDAIAHHADALPPAVLWFVEDAYAALVELQVRAAVLAEQGGAK